jgi:UDPglucose 6-dehydrogenase
VKPVGVVGLGAVGGTVAEAFSRAGVPTRTYDRYLRIGGPRELAGCAVVFVCVPTPSIPGGGHDLTELWSAVREVGPHLDPGCVVTVKSTVPPGTCDRLAAEFAGLEFAHVPEFLVEARPLETFTKPDRIVIGASSDAATHALTGLMRRVAPVAPMLIVRPVEAELVKLCSNALLAAKVSLANELAEVCGRFGAEWTAVQPGVGLDRRIGPDHLSVSPERGFGGKCLPKDLDGLIDAATSAGYVPTLLREVAEFNRRVRGEALVEGNGRGEGVRERAGDAGHA